MSKALTTKSSMQSLERILIHGDLTPMNETQRLQYVKAICKAIGVNILFRPFDYIKLQGKTVLYANRACTEQLRILHKISIKITARERVDGLYVVTAQATTSKGKTDESIGAVNIKGLSGETLANAMMKSETKAKRRVTLSIAGLGMLDEIEAKQIAEREAKVITELAVEESESKLAQGTERPEFETEVPSPSIDQEPPPQNDYKLRTMRGAIGKPIRLVSLKKLTDWLRYYDEMMNKGASLSSEVQDEAIQIRDFLIQAQFAKQSIKEKLDESQ